MFLIQKPSAAAITAILAEQSGKPFSYAPVGITRDGGTTTLRRTSHRVRLGSGENAFVRASAAMHTWHMYANGWTEIHPSGITTEHESVYAAVVYHLGFWSVNPCRVVYRDQTTDSNGRKEAFAVGTLPEHAERGEERFQVEWNYSDDSVWFEIIAFADPRHWLALLGTPIVWSLQRRFAEEALVLMRRAVKL